MGALANCTPATRSTRSACERLLEATKLSLDCFRNNEYFVRLACTFVRKFFRESVDRRMGAMKFKYLMMPRATRRWQ